MPNSQPSTKSNAVDLETGIDALLAEIEEASSELKRAMDPETPAPNALLSDDPDAAQPIPEPQSQTEQEAPSDPEPEAQATDIDTGTGAETDSIEPDAVEQDSSEADDASPIAWADADDRAEAETAASGIDADLASQVAALLENAEKGSGPDTPSPAGDQDASEPVATEPVASGDTDDAPQVPAAGEAVDTPPIADPTQGTEPANEPEARAEEVDEELAAFDAELATTAEDLEESVENEDDFDALLDGSFEDADGVEVEVTDEQINDTIEEQGRADKATAASLQSPMDADDAAPDTTHEPGTATAKAGPKSDEDAEEVAEAEPKPLAPSKPRRASFDPRASVVMVLEVVSKPLLKQPPIVRDAAGWIAANTLFLGVCVWAWHAWFQNPAAKAGDVPTVGLVESAEATTAENAPTLLNDLGAK